MSDWQSRGACRGKPPKWWFPEHPNPDYSRARIICATCPVTKECLAHALEVEEPIGMWGGHDPTQRRKLKWLTPRVERQQP